MRVEPPFRLGFAESSLPCGRGSSHSAHSELTAAPAGTQASGQADRGVQMNVWTRAALACAAVAALTILSGAASAGPQRQMLTTVSVDTLPIANALPMTLGVNKGFFAKHGIEIKTQTLQSGNDIVLALANHNGDIGFLGYTPMMIARTSGIPLTLVAASDVEGTSEADNWQN